MDVTPYRPRDRSWRNTTPVRQTDRIRARWLWVLFLGVFAAAAPLVAYLVQKNRNADLGYRLERVQDSLHRAEEIERHLDLERAALETLPRAERAAARLGLQRPTPDALVMVQVGSPAIEGLMARAPDDENPDDR